MLSFNVSASYARSGVRDCARVCFPVFMCIGALLLLHSYDISVAPVGWILCLRHGRGVDLPHAQMFKFMHDKKNSYYSERREFANLASYLGKERERSATFNVVVTLDDA